MRIDGSTLLKDLCQSLVGEEVVVYTTGPNPLGGKLVDFNGGILHLTSGVGIKNIYIPTNSIVAICGDK